MDKGLLVRLFILCHVGMRGSRQEKLPGEGTKRWKPCVLHHTLSGERRSNPGVRGNKGMVVQPIAKEKKHQRG